MERRRVVLNCFSGAFHVRPTTCPWLSIFIKTSIFQHNKLSEVVKMRGSYLTSVKKVPELLQEANENGRHDWRVGPMFGTSTQ